MMQHEDLIGHSLAMVFASEVNGELEWEIITGLIEKGPECLQLTRSTHYPIAVHDKWLPRIQRVIDSPDDIQQMVEADYWLIVTIGDCRTNDQANRRLFTVRLFP